MRIKLFIFFAILFCAVGYGVWDRYAPPSNTYFVELKEPSSVVGKIAPNVTFTDLEGQSYDLHTLKGKVILINFWATWCPPCVAEFPDLLTLASQYPEELILLTVSIDKNADNITDFFVNFDEDIQEKLALNNVILAHDQSQSISRDLFKIYRYPESLILAPDLTITKKIEGLVDIDDARLHRTIKNLGR